MSVFKNETKPYLGSAVENGKPRYTSISALKTLDQCERAWWFRYVMGFKGEQSAAQKKGDELDKEISNYIAGVETELGPLALSGKQYFPDTTTQDVWLQEPIFTMRDGIIIPSVNAFGVPLVGYIDIRTPSLITDVKSTSNVKYTHQTADELKTDLQMVTYAFHGWNRQGHRDPMPLRHWYFLTKGKAKSWVVDATIGFGEAQEIWNARGHVLGQRLKVVAAVPTGQQDRVPFNINHCDAYGGCPHRSRCVEGSKQLLKDMASANEPIAIPATIQEGNETMAFLKDDVKQAMDKLKANETDARLEATRVAYYLEVIDSVGHGLPPLTGHVAQLEARNKGLPEGTERIEGTGTLATIQGTIKTIDDLVMLARELGISEAQLAFNPIPPTPAQAPAPVLAAPVLPPPTAPLAEGTQTTIAAAPPALAEGIMPPDAPPADQRKRRGRPPKDGSVTAESANTAGEQTGHHIPASFAPVVPPIAQPAPTPTVSPVAEHAARVQAEQAQAGIRLYIDCLPMHDVALPLQAYVTETANALAKHFRVPDIRFSNGDNKSPLAYAAWRGALAAATVANPPPPGVYFIDTRYSEFAQEVAQSLSGIAQIVVRGLR